MFLVKHIVGYHKALDYSIKIKSKNRITHIQLSENSNQSSENIEINQLPKTETCPLKSVKPPTLLPFTNLFFTFQISLP